MATWFVILAFAIVYVALTQWLLPKLGIPTGGSRHRTESRCETTATPDPPLKDRA